MRLRSTALALLAAAVAATVTAVPSDAPAEARQYELISIVDHLGP